MRAAAAALALAASVLAGCSGGAAPPTAPTTAPASAATAAPAPAATEVTGTFEGFFHFEAQCHYLVVGDQKWSLDVPDGYRVLPDRPWDPSSTAEANPVLRGNDGEIVANDGDTLTVTGVLEKLPPGGPCFTEQIFRATTISAA